MSPAAETYLEYSAADYFGIRAQLLASQLAQIASIIPNMKSGWTFELRKLMRRTIQFANQTVSR